MSQQSTGLSREEKRAARGAGPALGSVLAVPPREAARLLSVSITRIYQMMNTGQLENFHDNTSRRITMKSLEAYIARRLAVARKRARA